MRPIHESIEEAAKPATSVARDRIACLRPKTLAPRCSIQATNCSIHGIGWSFQATSCSIQATKCSIQGTGWNIQAPNKSIKGIGWSIQATGWNIWWPNMIVGAA